MSFAAERRPQRQSQPEAEQRSSSSRARGAPAGIPLYLRQQLAADSASSNTNASTTASFNPDTVDVVGMSNELLRGELLRVQDWLGARSDASPERAAYSALHMRLQGERQRRVAMGHKWLESDVRATQPRLYQLTQAEDGTTVVVSIDASQVIGAPADLRGSVVMTPAQFQDALVEQGIPPQSATNAAIQGVVGGRMYVPAQDLYGVPAASAFDYPIGSDALGRFQVIDARRLPPVEIPPGATRAPVSPGGTLPEVLTMYHGTNQPEGLMSGGRGRLSTTFTAGVGDDFSRGVYLSEDITVGLSGAQGRSGQTGGTPYLLRFDVPREGLGQNIVDIRPGGAHWPQWESWLAQVMLTQNANGEFVEPPPQMAKVLRDMGLTNGEYLTRNKGIEERGLFFEEFLRRLRAQDADVIFGTIGDTATTGMIGSRYPQSTQIVVRSQQTGDRLNALIEQAAPVHSTMAELNTAARLGPGLATMRAGAQGGVAGGVIAVVFEGGIMLFDERDHPLAGQELGTAAGLGVGGGAVGGAVEQAVITRVAASGISSPVKAVFFRGLAGGAGGGIASIGVEAFRIGVLEDRPHSARETTLRLGREGAIGATSGVLGTIAGTALTGALAGSVAPGVGTAAGFVVGFIVGVGSALLLNSIVPTVEPD